MEHIKYHENLNENIQIFSENYGNYIVTKVFTIDMINACKSLNLKNVSDFWNLIMKKFPSLKTITLNEELFNVDYKLFKFDVYIPLKEYNLSWKDLKNHYKIGELPISITKTQLIKILKSMKNEYKNR